MALRITRASSSPEVQQNARHSGKKAISFKKLTTGNWGFAPTFADSALLELSTADLQESQHVSWLDSTLLGSTVIKTLSGLPNPCEMSNAWLGCESREIRSRPICFAGRVHCCARAWWHQNCQRRFVPLGRTVAASAHRTKLPHTLDKKHRCTILHAGTSKRFEQKPSSPVLQDRR